MQHHLAILAPGWIEPILEGTKTIESRFTKVRCAPYGKVNIGDLVYMKESGGPVKGQFTVAAVETYDNLTDAIVDQIYDTHCEEILVNTYDYNTPPLKWYFSRYATLIHVENVVAYGNPFPYKQNGRSAWLLLDAPLIDTHN